MLPQCISDSNNHTAVVQCAEMPLARRPTQEVLADKLGGAHGPMSLRDWSGDESLRARRLEAMDLNFD